ncbi:MAG: hypothetical protein AB7S44_04175 [Spirochaetales bacterium]
MKKIKIVSVLLVLALATSLFSACSLGAMSATASSVYQKYSDIVEKYYNETDAVNSFFNANGKFYVTYETGNLTQEMAKTSSMFNLLSNEYPQMLYSSMAFFYEYKESLNLTSNTFSKAGVGAMYEALLSLDSKLENFEVRKLALENITIIDDDPSVDGFDYELNIRNIYNAFIAAYDEVIRAALDLNYAFAQDYIANIAVMEDYETLTEIPTDEVKRISYTAEVYTVEAAYNYYIDYLGGFKIENCIVIRDDQTLYDNLVTLSDNIDNVPLVNWRAANTNLTAIDYYKVTLQREEYLVTERNFYLSAISEYNKLKDNTDSESLALLDGYESTVTLVNEDYNLYIALVNNLLNFVL